jgi:hypothetical protein
MTQKRPAIVIDGYYQTLAFIAWSNHMSFSIIDRPSILSPTYFDGRLLHDGKERNSELFGSQTTIRAIEKVPELNTGLLTSSRIDELMLPIADRTGI